MHLSIASNWLLFSIGEQVIEVEQEVIMTNYNLLFHFSGHNNDLLVLKQWKGVFIQIMHPLWSFGNSGNDFILQSRFSKLSCTAYSLHQGLTLTYTSYEILDLSRWLLPEFIIAIFLKKIEITWRSVSVACWTLTTEMWTIIIIMYSIWTLNVVVTFDVPSLWAKWLSRQE